MHQLPQSRAADGEKRLRALAFGLQHPGRGRPDSAISVLPNCRTGHLLVPVTHPFLKSENLKPKPESRSLKAETRKLKPEARPFARIAGNVYNGRFV
jgi:hypothetical protein